MNIGKEASEKLTGMIEERIKTKPLPTSSCYSYKYDSDIDMAKNG